MRRGTLQRRGGGREDTWAGRTTSVWHMSERDGADDVRSGMSANPDSITSLSDAISIMNVPWERRLQTAAVASFVYALPIMFLCVVWSVALLLNPLTFLPMAVYAAWIYCDSAPQTGARKSEW